MSPPSFLEDLHGEREKGGGRKLKLMSKYIICHITVCTSLFAYVYPSLISQTWFLVLSVQQQKINNLLFIMPERGNGREGREGQREREIEINRQKETRRDRERQKETERDKERERQKETRRERDRERERERVIKK